MPGTLPRMAPTATDTDAPMSLARHIQFNEVLEAGLEALLGHGITDGGTVTQTAALSVSLAAGTTFFQNGASYTLSAAQSYTIPGSSSTVWLWGRIARTAADDTDPTEEDTYACEITHSLTSANPDSETYTPLAVIYVSGGAILAVTEPASGKYLSLSGSSYVYNSDFAAFVEQLNEALAGFDALLLWMVDTFGTVPPGTETALEMALRRAGR